MVELRQLRHIVLLHELKSFSKAAKAANISQPSLSVSVKKAEQVLGAKLFTRKSSSIKTTARGEIIVEMAREMLATYKEGVKKLSKTKNKAYGSVNFGIDPFLARSVMEGFLPEMYKKHPKIRFKVNINPWNESIELLKREELDFIIVIFSRKEDFPDKEFDKKEMYIPKAAYFTRRNHPLAKLKKVDSRLLRNYLWIGNEVSPRWREWAMKMADITEEQFENIYLTKVNNYDKIVDLIVKNNAVSGNVYEELIPYVNAGKISILDISWAIDHPENIGIILSLKGKELSPACHTIIEEIQQYSQKWKEG